MNLYNADCFEVMAGLPDKSIDCVITDPPYGIDFQSHRRKEKYDKIQNDNDLSFLDDLNKELFRVMKDNTHIYICFVLLRQLISLRLLLKSILN